MKYAKAIMESSNFFIPSKNYYVVMWRNDVTLGISGKW